MSACEVLIMVAVLSVVLIWVLKELTGTSLQSAKFVSQDACGCQSESIINRSWCFYNEKYA